MANKLYSKSNVWSKFLSKSANEKNVDPYQLHYFITGNLDIVS